MDWAKLNVDVVRGRSRGRILWQPRILCWYDERVRRGEPLPSPYTGMDIYALHRALNCSRRVYDFNSCFSFSDDPRVHFSTVQKGDLVTTTIETPVGSQKAVFQINPNSDYRKHLKWPVSDRNELEVLIWRIEHFSWSWDQQKYDELLGQIGDLGAPSIYFPRINIQALYIEHMGTEPAIYATYDWPDLIDAYCRVWLESADRAADVVSGSPLEIINFGDNIHSGTLPPELFTRYVLPAYQHLTDRLHRADADKFLHAHWDGDTKALLPFARETGLDGIEALTPVPQGDVTLEEIKDALGDEMFLLDGIPAVFFEPTFSQQELIECVNRLIELFAPKLILGISDEMPYMGEISRVELVADIVAEYNRKQG